MVWGFISVVGQEECLRFAERFEGNITVPQLPLNAPPARVLQFVPFGPFVTLLELAFNLTYQVHPIVQVPDNQVLIVHPHPLSVSNVTATHVILTSGDPIETSTVVLKVRIFVPPTVIKTPLADITKEVDRQRDNDTNRDRAPLDRSVMTITIGFDISADGGRMTYNGGAIGDSFEAETDNVIIAEPSLQRDTDTRPISGLSDGINTSSSDSLPIDVNDDCSIDLANLDGSFRGRSTYTASNAAGVRYTKDDYDSLKRASEEMFTRLQCTAAFLDRLNTALQGHTDPVSQELVNTISNLKLNSVIADVDKAFAVADEAEKSMGDAAMPSLTTISRNQSIGSIVTAEAAVIKSQVIELKEKLADMEAQLAEANSRVAIRDEIIDEIRSRMKPRPAHESEADIDLDEVPSNCEIVVHLGALSKELEATEKFQEAQEVKIGQLQAELKECKTESAAILKELQETQADINKQTQIMVKLNKERANESVRGDDSPKKAKTVDMEIQFGADYRTRASEEANLELMTDKCAKYEAYLKSIAEMALNEDSDETLVEPPEAIDPTVHESIMSAITAAKKIDSEGFQRVMAELSHAGDTTVVENNPDATLEVAKILDRVAKSKELSNLLVQALKKLSAESEKSATVVSKLLQWSRDSRETHIFVEAHLKAFKKDTTQVDEHIPEILSEVEGIYKVLRDVQNDRIAAKRNRMATKSGKSKL